MKRKRMDARVAPLDADNPISKKDEDDLVELAMRAAGRLGRLTRPETESATIEEGRRVAEEWTKQWVENGMPISREVLDLATLYGFPTMCSVHGFDITQQDCPECIAEQNDQTTTDLPPLLKAAESAKEARRSKKTDGN